MFWMSVLVLVAVLIFFAPYWTRCPVTTIGSPSVSFRYWLLRLPRRSLSDQRPAPALPRK